MTGPAWPWLESVLAVLYLVFNEGFLASAGEAAVRRELCSEAIRRAAIVADLMPDRPETHGLLALLCSRTRVGRRALGWMARSRCWRNRTAPAGTAPRSAAASGVLDRGFAAAARPSHAAVGHYLLQASIAAEHARTFDGRTTDWRAISTLYEALARIDPSPIVELNRAVAVAQADGPVDGPVAGLRLLDDLAARGELAAYHLLPAAWADLLRRLGRLPEAAAEYEHALALCDNDAERRFLQRRLAETRS